jgi:hypothetical protein
MKSCKTSELGFLKLVEVKKPWTIGKGRGERSSRTIEQTYKHTFRTLGMEGNTCRLMETQIECCFAMHMLLSTNRNTKKHLEEVKKHLQIL